MQGMSLFKCKLYNGMGFPERLRHLSCCHVQLTIIIGLSMSVNILMSKGGLLYAK